jgi:6-phosphofructokinase 1
MGRNAGWIALHAGMAGGADVILTPERPFDLADVADRVHKPRGRGRRFSLIVVAEGAAPVGGHLVTTGGLDQMGRPLLGGIGHWMQAYLEERTGAETRTVVLGHVQRGGTPTSYDRVLGSRLGQAAHLAIRDGELSIMAGARGTQIERVPLAEATARLNTVPIDELELAEAFLG